MPAAGESAARDPWGRPALIRARGWGWRYPTRRAWAVRRLDLTVEPGERVLVLGASGSGKSTLLAGVAGLLDPVEGGEQEGHLTLDGVASRAARGTAVRAGAARTGLVLQDPQAQTVLARCGDDVAFGLENHAVPVEQIWPRVRAALRAVDFPYPPEHPTARLSGGQRQRLALAGVLALAPGVLLLDEPTAMLDPAAADALRTQVARLLAGTGTTLILVEHRVEPWLPLIDRVVVLEPGGGAIADGPAGAVLGDHGAALAAAGVWVPGHPPRPGRARSRSAGGAVLLRAEDLAVARPGAAPVVRGLNLDLPAGRARCLVGPNGSGKSTVALALGGLAAPAGGRVRAGARLSDGLVDAPHRWRPRELISRIGQVFQDPQHQFVTTSVAQELAVGPRRLGWPAQRVAHQVDLLLERMRLGALARANPFTLSGGEQRRLSVATALATRPALLVLDEPTFGQDRLTWAALVELFDELLAEGTALVTATHDEALVHALAGADPAGIVRLPADHPPSALDRGPTRAPAEDVIGPKT